MSTQKKRAAAAALLRRLVQTGDVDKLVVEVCGHMGDSRWMFHCPNCGKPSGIDFAKGQLMHQHPHCEVFGAIQTLPDALLWAEQARQQVVEKAEIAAEALVSTIAAAKRLMRKEQPN